MMKYQTANIGWNASEWYRSAFETARAEREEIQKGAAFRLAALEKRYPGRSRREICDAIRKLNSERLAATPDLRHYPELRGVADLVLADWKGIRDGAELDDDLWALHCDGGFIYKTQALSAPLPKRQECGRCTYIFFPTSDHGPLLANNLDSTPGEPFGEPPWPAVNEHLIWGPVSSGIFFDEQSPEIFPIPLKRLMGRYCRSTAEAVDFLTRYNLFWGPRNGILIDRNHHVAMIEKSSCRIAVRHSSDGFGFITSMTAEEPKFRAYLLDRRENSLKARGLDENSGDAAYWRGADNRRVLLTELLAEAKCNPTLAAIKKMIHYRSERGNVSCHGEPLSGGARSAYTLRTTVWQLSNREATWWGMEDGIPTHLAKSRRAVYPEVLAWS